ESLRTQESWTGRNDNTADAELTSYFRSVQRTGTAECKQCELTRVVSSLDGDRTDGLDHCRTGESSDTECRFYWRKLNSARKFVYRRFGQVAPYRHAP